ncbi:hypothetical protein KEM52_003919, partial [Ascosphaera acerosa]
MARFRENPFEFLKEVSLFVSGTGWRAYDNVIGQPVFYPGFSEKIKADICSHAMVRGKIAELARLQVDREEREGLLPLSKGAPHSSSASHSPGPRAERQHEIEASLKEVAGGIVDSMICKMDSNSFIRGAYFLCTQLLTRAYNNGIHASSEEILRLRQVAKDAQRKKRSIIFLPCHKSHVDYVSLHLICYRLGITLPIVVAGDNLNFPLVGPFLQHAGAMYIRRSFGNDPLYHTLVQSYVDVILRGGYNFECFVEGGRSRTGKLLPPKFGILSFVIDSILSGRVEDAIIVPVSTQYDKVIET